MDFRPFRAWRYSQDRVKLDDVVAPPYDVISAQEQERLYTRSPYNVVRLILGKESQFHDEARRRWKEWSRQGILRQESRPTLYLYEQEFRHPLNSEPLRRTALVGLLKLDRSGNVVPHEHTFSGPKRDRLLLLEKTRANLSPLFGLYRDSERSLPSLFSAYRSEPALFNATDSQKVTHRGWAIQKEEDKRRIHETLAGEKILIADGHHRYETALEYQRRMHEKFPSISGEAPYDFVMIALVEFSDPGLLMLPTHRVIRSFGSLPKPEFVKRLRDYFECKPFPPRELFPALERRPQEEKVFGIILGKEESFLLHLKNPRRILSKLPLGKPPLWYELEANLLTHFIFRKLWGLSEEEGDQFVEYTRSAEEASRRVTEGRAEAAFLMRPVEVDMIQKLADTGERMPQKTTYFYPKLASGLFFYHHG